MKKLKHLLQEMTKREKLSFLVFSKHSPAVIGSVFTLTVVPHIDYFNEQGTAVESENTGGTETAQQQETSSYVQQVSAENSFADVIEQASKAVVGISLYSAQNHSFGQPFVLGRIQGCFSTSCGPKG